MLRYKPENLLAVLLLVGAAAVLVASKPVFWQTATVNDFLRGEVENLSVDSHGRLVLGPATELFSEALRIAPDAREIHENIGQALERQGRRDEAAVHFARARALASPSRAVGK